jgi:hypothetical protein
MTFCSCVMMSAPVQEPTGQRGRAISGERSRSPLRLIGPPIQSKPNSQIKSRFLQFTYRLIGAGVQSTQRIRAPRGYILRGKEQGVQFLDKALTSGIAPPSLLTPFTRFGASPMNLPEGLTVRVWRKRNRLALHELARSRYPISAFGSAGTGEQSGTRGYRHDQAATENRV